MFERTRAPEGAAGWTGWGRSAAVPWDSWPWNSSKVRRGPGETGRARAQACDPGGEHTRPDLATGMRLAYSTGD